VLRVSQIDAGRLDGELTSLLREQFLRIFSRVQPGAVARAAPELNLGLDLLVFYFTVWSHRPTPGMELMNLRYRDERRVNHFGKKSGMHGEKLATSQRVAALAACVFGRYAWSKLTRTASVGRWAELDENTWRRRASRTMNRLELAHSSLSLANFLLFLFDGKYPSLWQRASAARLVYDSPEAERVVSYEYLNRQIVWQELSDLALFVLPIVSSHAARFRDGVRGGRSAEGGSSAGETGGRDERLRDHRSPSVADVPISSPCAACARSPATNPFVLEPCGHVHCYYCARARAARAGGENAAEAGFRCSECGGRATGMRRARVALRERESREPEA
jgi:peroxin-2